MCGPGKNADDWNVYKKLRNCINNILKTEKQAWHSEKMRIASKNTSKTWKMVKSVLGWNTGGPPKCISVGGRFISKPKEIATEMNCYFINKIKGIVENLPQSQYDPSILTQQFMRNRKCTFALHAVHPDVVEKIISNSTIRVVAALSS